MGRKQPRDPSFAAHFIDEEFAIEWCIGFLRERGFRVVMEDGLAPLETVKALLDRLLPTCQPVLHRTTLHRRLNHPGAPAFLHESGSTGRIVRVRPSQALIDWLTRPVPENRRKIRAGLEGEKVTT